MRLTLQLMALAIFFFLAVYATLMAIDIAQLAFGAFTLAAALKVLPAFAATAVLARSMGLWKSNPVLTACVMALASAASYLAVEIGFLPLLCGLAGECF